MAQLLKGTDVKLYNADGSYDVVSNVLIGQETSAASATEVSTYGELLGYTLGIPKDDAHDWQDKRVDFFGKSFRTVGLQLNGISENIPLSWGSKIVVKLIKQNGNITVYDKDTWERHCFEGVLYADNRSEIYTKDGRRKEGELTVRVYSVYRTSSYRVKPGDIIVLGNCDFAFDTSDQQHTSDAMKSFKKSVDYAVVSSVVNEMQGSLPDVIITAK